MNINNQRLSDRSFPQSLTNYPLESKENRIMERLNDENADKNPIPSDILDENTTYSGRIVGD